MDYNPNYRKPFPAITQKTQFYATTHYQELLPQLDGNFDSLSSSDEEMPVEVKQKSKRAARAEKRSADRAVRAETRQIRAKKAKFV